MNKRWYILWTTTLRSKSLIDYIVYKFNGSVWMPCFIYKDNIIKDKQIPIYPSYYFINASELEILHIQTYIKEYKYNGLTFLKKGEHLAYLTEEEIAQIKYIEQNYTIDKYLNIDPNIQINSRVKIKEGPFVNLEGEIEEIRNRDVLIKLDNNNTSLWCSIDNLELVN